MKKGILIFAFLLLVGCGGSGTKTKSSSINPADTTNFFFSGVLNLESNTFTDCSNAKSYHYEFDVANSRSINEKINSTIHVSSKELYCKVRGRLVYDPSQDQETFIIDNSLSMTRLQKCDKPLLPNKYISNNTYKNSYSLILNDDYTYTIELDGREVETGTWGKIYEYQGVMMWHSPTDTNRKARTFTIEYLAYAVMVTLEYDGQYLIFS
ncbi:MAG: hypothetical protein RRZ64_07780 [Rikenellaceae bacterium]